ncbi:MAG: helix-turn-helix domain-containing protein [Actinomycetota bacterium]
MTKINRVRGICISEDGKNITRHRLCELGITQEKLAEKTFLSSSTVKRLLRGENVDLSSFREVCSLLELNPNELIVSPTSSPPKKSGIALQHFMITGTFNLNKLAEIEVALNHLGNLLRDSCTITVERDNGSLAVNGTFSEDKKPQVELAIAHLQKLMLEHTLTL